MVWAKVHFGLERATSTTVLRFWTRDPLENEILLVELTVGGREGRVLLHKQMSLEMGGEVLLER